MVDRCQHQSSVEHTLQRSHKPSHPRCPPCTCCRRSPSSDRSAVSVSNTVLVWRRTVSSVVDGYPNSIHGRFRVSGRYPVHPNSNIGFAAIDKFTVHGLHADRIFHSIPSSQHIPVCHNVPVTGCMVTRYRAIALVPNSSGFTSSVKLSECHKPSNSRILRLAIVDLSRNQRQLLLPSGNYSTNC